MEPLVISANQAKTLLAVDSTRVYEMLENGELPAYREGRNWKIPLELLREYVNTRAVKEAEERKNEKVQMEQGEI